MTHFFILFAMRKMAFLDYVLNYVSSVLMQSEDISNFHSSLTLNKWKLAGRLWCVRYDSFFFILFGMREKMAYFELCVSSVLMQNKGIWNFHSSLTLNKGKLI